MSSAKSSGASSASDPWQEVGDRVFSRRYRFMHQQIGVILTDAGPVVIDTRSTVGHAREILADLAELSRLPVAAVIDTHHHFDHSFGNHEFRPAPIWGHVRCIERIRRNVDDAAAHARNLASIAEEYPSIAGELAGVQLDPPDQPVGDDGADLEIGGRLIELRWLGRGHTDNDLVIRVPDAPVVFAGDLLENGAPPWLGDGYPLDWVATIEAILELLPPAGSSQPGVAVVPGHGDVGDRAFVERSLAEMRAIVDLAGRVHGGAIGLADAILAAPYPAESASEALDRALGQLRGQLVSG
jgi:glyoxylase-like metal-dependent hydrolase (beta-lactamase superfamily II)